MYNGGAVREPRTDREAIDRQRVGVGCQAAPGARGVWQGAGMPWFGPATTGGGRKSGGGSLAPLYRESPDT